jgi:hypothetical protein
MATIFVNAPRVNDDLVNLNRWPRVVSEALNTIGNTHYGSEAITPDGSGNGTITHNFSITPSYVNVNISGDNQYVAKVQSVSATTITVLIIDAAGADVTSGTYTVYWLAKI